MFPWSLAIAVVVVVVVFPGMVMRTGMGSVRTVFWGPARRGRRRRGVGIVGGIMLVL